MVLNKWSTGDVLDQIPLNNRSIRKGTESEILAISSVENQEGDMIFNTTYGFLQVQKGGESVDKRGNIAILIGADSSIISVVGSIPTEVKNIDYVKHPSGFRGNQLTIVARIKTSNTGTVAHLIVEKNGGPSDELDLTTVSASYETVTGTIDISGDRDGVHTLEFYLRDGAGDTCTLQQLEIYGI